MDENKGRRGVKIMKKHYRSIGKEKQRKVLKVTRKTWKRERKRWEKDWWEDLLNECK